MGVVDSKIGVGGCCGWGVVGSKMVGVAVVG